ncbi:hypothetical protein [Nitrosomonas europaea]|uniref:hypothetical protein n=1 Tax=Nitrosomonas europaea TaxID=915 RepID=UPI003BB7BA50
MSFDANIVTQYYVLMTIRTFRCADPETLFKSNTTGKAGGLGGERLKGAHETVSRPWRLPYISSFIWS